MNYRFIATVAGGGGQHPLRLYDQTNDRYFKITPASSVSVSKDRKLLAAIDCYNVHIWDLSDVDNGICIQCIHAEGPGTKSFEKTTILPDNQSIAIIISNKVIEVTAIRPMQQGMRNRERHLESSSRFELVFNDDQDLSVDEIQPMCSTRDGKLLVIFLCVNSSRAKYYKLCAWDVTNRVCTKIADLPPGGQSGCRHKFCCTEEFIVTEYVRGKLAVIDAANGNLLRIVKQDHTWTTTGVAISYQPSTQSTVIVWQYNNAMLFSYLHLLEDCDEANLPHQDGN